MTILKAPAKLFCLFIFLLANNIAFNQFVPQDFFGEIPNPPYCFWESQGQMTYGKTTLEQQGEPDVVKDLRYYTMGTKAKLFYLMTKCLL